MSKKLKLNIAKGAGALALTFVAATGATHLSGGNSDAGFSAQEMGEVTLASAQMGELVGSAQSQIPADALTPGKALKPAPQMAVVDPSTDCTVSFDARLMEGAMVRLTAKAPCDPATPIALRHEGVAFDMLTDAKGALSIDVPALAPIAMFEADIGGETLRTIAAIPDFEDYDRVALQWQGQTGLHIHALEFGADYGTDGHVWADAPGTALRAVRARGGFITRLGDAALTDGHAAEIYVFPAGMMQRTGTVRLSVEAEINAFTCGKAVNGQALQTDTSGKLKSTALTLEIPECDAIGDILVLKNLLRDMKIASN